MDFRFTPQQLTLKKEFEDFFREEMRRAPQLVSAEHFCDSDEGWAFHRYLARKMGDKEWLSMAWPEEYGGRNASIIDQLIFSEVRAYYRTPGIDVQGIGMLAPTLIVAGTEEQKQKFLPPIAAGEVHWCQGWSEPNAGSDLASLTTRASRDGDEYVINGQKTWTSAAHRADWCFMLARTDPNEPRHRGLSYFLVDMKSPGLSLRTIKSMDGTHMFNEMFFDDVVVPKANLVGEENKGWYVSLMTMNFERTSVGGMSEAKRDLEELIDFTQQTTRSGRTLSEDPIIRQKLAQLATEIEVGRMLSYHVACLQEKGTLPADKASVAKIYASELIEKMARTGCQILGSFSQILPGSKWAPLMGRFASAYQHCLTLKIAGGTSEIQRNIIATRGLGLPRID